MRIKLIYYKHIKKIILLAILSILLFSSCTAYKELPYLTNNQISVDSLLMETTGLHEPTIMPLDVLSIIVNSSVPGAAADFNLASVPLTLNTISGGGSTGSATLLDYHVDREGKITFPVLGQINMAGLTTTEAQEYIASMIYPKYITEKPIVDVRFTNFNISVLGEVARPGIYKSENGQMTILDALAAAGDMTLYGKRNNVLLLRTMKDGSIAKHRINLQDESVLLNKDIYYLQQNDKIYVETNKAKGNNSRIGTFETLSLSIISLALSIVSFSSRWW